MDTETEMLRIKREACSNSIEVGHPLSHQHEFTSHILEGRHFLVSELRIVEV